MKAMPKPSSAIGARICHSSLVGASPRARPTSTASAVIAKPMPVSMRGCTRSVSLPTIGAITIDTSAIGTNSSAASVGDRPRTS